MLTSLLGGGELPDQMDMPPQLDADFSPIRERRDRYRRLQILFRTAESVTRSHENGPPDPASGGPFFARKT